MAWRSRAVVVAAVISLVATACGGDDTDDGAGGPTTTAAGTSTSATTDDTGTEPTRLSVVAEDFSFSGAPEQVEAGVFAITFENAGAVEHELAFVEIGDTPLDEVGGAIAPTLEGGPFPDFLENLAIPAVAEPGQTVETTALLAEGNYALICTLTGAVPEPGATTTTGGGGGPEEGPQGPPHHELGMIQPFTVTTSSNPLTLPANDSAITARDYDFDVRISAGPQTVNFVNEGPDQVHHGVFFAFNEGVDETAAEAALLAFASSEEEAPPPPELDLPTSETLPHTGVFSSGLGATYEMDFQSGRTYAVVCFIQDRSGGPPHLVAHDMKEIFTVQ